MPKKQKKQNRGQLKKELRFDVAQRQALKQKGIDSTLAVPSQASSKLITNTRSRVVSDLGSPSILQQPRLSDPRKRENLEFGMTLGVKSFDAERSERKRLCRVKVVKGKKITVCKDKKSKKKTKPKQQSQTDFFRGFL